MCNSLMDTFDLVSKAVEGLLIGGSIYLLTNARSLLRPTVGVLQRTLLKLEAPDKMRFIKALITSLLDDDPYDKEKIRPYVQELILFLKNLID